MSLSPEEAAFLRNAGALDIPKDQCPPDYVYCDEIGCVPPDAIHQLWPDRKWVRKGPDLTGGRRRKRAKAKSARKSAPKVKRGGKSRKRTKKRTVRKIRAKTGKRSSRR
jgi:hypothetical protein